MPDGLGATGDAARRRSSRASGLEGIVERGTWPPARL